jgi:hypothetical protein
MHGSPVSGALGRLGAVTLKRSNLNRSLHLAFASQADLLLSHYPIWLLLD